MRNKGPILLSAVLGVLAVVFMWTYLSARETQLLELSSMRDVVVATRDITAHTLVDETMVQVIQVPAKYVQPKTVTDPRDAVGRVLAVPISQGTQIASSHLLSDRDAVLSYEVPRGMRALTIAVSDVTGVGGLIRAGNFVDIIGTFEYGRPLRDVGGVIQYADERTEIVTLMQNVQIVAVGQETIRTVPPPVVGEQPTDAQPPSRAAYSNVTVLVPPKQVQDLILAQQVGTLTLSLRADLDNGQASLDRLDPFGLLKVQIPVKPRPMPVWREIRGTSY
jgi:pilus assembly protein CpaB